MQGFSGRGLIANTTTTNLVPLTAVRVLWPPLHRLLRCFACENLGDVVCKRECHTPPAVISTPSQLHTLRNAFEPTVFAPRSLGISGILGPSIGLAFFNRRARSGFQS